MASPIKIDIWDQSSYTVGVSTQRYARATRYAYASGLTPSLSSATVDTGLKQASDSFIAKYGYFHHLNTVLPLAYLTVKRWGPNTAFIYAQYQHRQISIQHPPNQLIAQASTGLWPVKWYRKGPPFDGTFGFPNGAIRGLPDEVGIPSYDRTDFEPRSKRLLWPTIELSVPATLAFDPLMAGLADLSGKINNNTTNLFGYSIGKYRALFNGAQVRFEYNAQNNSTTYGVHYSLSLCRQGFWSDQGVWFGDGIAPNGDEQGSNPAVGITGDMWRTQNELAYEPVTFPTTWPTG